MFREGIHLHYVWMESLKDVSTKQQLFSRASEGGSYVLTQAVWPSEQFWRWEATSSLIGALCMWLCIWTTRETAGKVILLGWSCKAKRRAKVELNEEQNWNPNNSELWRCICSYVPRMQHWLHTWLQSHNIINNFDLDLRQTDALMLINTIILPNSFPVFYFYGLLLIHFSCNLAQKFNSIYIQFIS